MLDLNTVDMSITGLQQHYHNKDFTPEQLVRALLSKCESFSDNPIWITKLTAQQLEPYLKALQAHSVCELPLYGVPFAIKDNIDLANIPTTAACPEFQYLPEKSATIVQQLIAAGAIPLGKTNMDQFATGLVGVRSPEPWGPCKNALNREIISGGSSSGSAVAVSLGLVSFSLGTDTAGSGRVPASLNNIVGLKPTRGLLSCNGVVPACKSLDCVSIFALNCDDTNRVFDVAAQFDSADAYSRSVEYANGSRYYHANRNPLRIGIPNKAALQFFESDEAQMLYSQFLEHLPSQIETVEIDISPFLEAARLLYEGPWVAERYHAIHPLIENSPEALLPVIKTIVGGGKQPRALEAFDAQYKLQKFKQLADAQLKNIDALLTPTHPRYFSIAEVEQDPITLNSKMGYYTNFMNLLDYSAVAIPIGFFSNGVGYGITLLHQAQQDKNLLSIAATLQNHLKIPQGALKRSHTTQGDSGIRAPYNCTDIAVCGAHLQGLPLNWQLQERGAQRVQIALTSENYKLYALPGGPPYRPALVRAEQGAKVEIEVWRVPNRELGSFVNEIPAPLGIGKLELEDGRWVSGFICDAWGLNGAKDITHYGGWRAYLAADKGNADY